MRYHSSNVFDKFPRHLRRYLLFDQRLTQNSVEKMYQKLEISSPLLKDWRLVPNDVALSKKLDFARRITGVSIHWNGVLNHN